MPEYGFSSIHILPYKDRIYDSFLYGRIRVIENLYSRIFYEQWHKAERNLWGTYQTSMMVLFWVTGLRKIVFQKKILRYIRDHPFYYVRKFSEKLTFLTPDTQTYQGVRNISFPENLAHVLNGWSLSAESFS